MEWSSSQHTKTPSHAPVRMPMTSTSTTEHQL